MSCVFSVLNRWKDWAGPHSGGNGWADTDLVPRHIDGISLSLAKTCGGPVRGLQVGPEPTLLVAVDGEIEYTEGRESMGLRSQSPQKTPTHSYQSFLNCSFYHYFPNCLIHTFMHSSIYLSITSLTHSFPLLSELFPLQKHCCLCQCSPRPSSKTQRARGSIPTPKGS